jgi:hypothetical protein
MDLLIQYAGPAALPVRPRELGTTGVTFIRVRWDNEPDRSGGIVHTTFRDPAREGETKWSHVARLDDLWSMVERAEVVCFADDDVQAFTSWHEAFRLFRRLPLDVAQCALSRDSYWSHAVTLVDPESAWRETNFVEMMAPMMLGRQALEWREAFRDVGTAAWGVECLWSGGRKRCGILDWTPMRHTRPVRAWWNATRLGVADPVAERAAFCARWGLRVPDYAFETLRRHASEPREKVGVSFETK